MKLIARHFDGFTEHLVTWELLAENGTAIVDASYRGPSGRVETVLEMPFPDSRIAEFATTLRGLKPKYDGHVDDFPHYWLTVVDDSTELKTEVLAGMNWPDADKPDIDSFMSVWEPLYRDVEHLLEIPGRR